MEYGSRTWNDRAAGPCPDGGASHGPPNSDGTCPWCRNKVACRMPAPRRYPVSELTEAYEEFYDPDWGALGATEVRRRLMAGTAYY